MSLLIDEPPLLVQPSLAKAVGLNEAIVLQQIHYWAQRAEDGWANQTLRRWHQQFPFWSLSTIKRVMAKLRDAELLVVEHGNEDPFDRSNRYRVGYHALARLDHRGGQSDPGGGGQIDPVSKETERTETASCSRDDVDELWDHFVAVCQPANPRLTASRRTVLRRALNEAPLETCRRAVEGMKAHAARRGGKLDISRVFRTRPGGDALADQIEWWASQASPDQPNGDATYAALPVWVREALVLYGDYRERAPRSRVDLAIAWLHARSLKPVWTKDRSIPELVRENDATHG